MTPVTTVRVLGEEGEGRRARRLSSSRDLSIVRRGIV